MRVAPLPTNARTTTFVTTTPMVPETAAVPEPVNPIASMLTFSTESAVTEMAPPAVTVIPSAMLDSTCASK